MSSKDRSTRESLTKEKKDTAFIHVRVDQDLKDDLAKYAREEHTSITSVVTALCEDLLYKQVEEDKLDEEEELLDLIVSSLMNLERRMEIRLATLQDTFNSLIGRLIDSQQLVSPTKASRLMKRQKGETDDDEETDYFSDILDVDREDEIYKRVERFLSQQAKIVDLKTVIAQIEVDRKLKQYLEEQDRNVPGWKEALITDAIHEAAQNLGFPMLDS